MGMSTISFSRPLGPFPRESKSKSTTCPIAPTYRLSLHLFGCSAGRRIPHGDLVDRFPKARGRRREYRGSIGRAPGAPRPGASLTRCCDCLGHRGGRRRAGYSRVTGRSDGGTDRLKDSGRRGRRDEFPQTLGEPLIVPKNVGIGSWP